MKTRRRFTAEFKAKIALEAIELVSISRASFYREPAGKNEENLAGHSTSRSSRRRGMGHDRW